VTTHDQATKVQIRVGWKSLEFGGVRKAKKEKKNLGQRITTEGRQRHMATLSSTAHGRSPTLGLNPTKASRTHSGLFCKLDRHMGIMNMNKYVIEAAAYLSTRSGETAVKCLPTKMAGFSSRKNIATLKKKP